MADVGADPALIYAFQRTGVYVCEENERRLSRSQLAAWNGAVDEYYKTLAGPRQSTRPRAYGCRDRLTGGQPVNLYSPPGIAYSQQAHVC